MCRLNQQGTASHFSLESHPKVHAIMFFFHVVEPYRTSCILHWKVILEGSSLWFLAHSNTLKGFLSHLCSFKLQPLRYFITFSPGRSTLEGTLSYFIYHRHTLEDICSSLFYPPGHQGEWLDALWTILAETN